MQCCNENTQIQECFVLRLSGKRWSQKFRVFHAPSNNPTVTFNVIASRKTHRLHTLYKTRKTIWKLVIRFDIFFMRKKRSTKHSLVFHIDYKTMHKDGFSAGKLGKTDPFVDEKFNGSPENSDLSRLCTGIAHMPVFLRIVSKDQMDSNGRPHQICGQARKGLTRNYSVSKSTLNCEMSNIDFRFETTRFSVQYFEGPNGKSRTLERLLSNIANGYFPRFSIFRFRLFRTQTET